MALRWVPTQLSRALRQRSAFPGSSVEVRFTVLSENQTRVELKQSNWEAFGKLAKDLQGGYGKGWTIIFESAYKAACGG